LPKIAVYVTGDVPDNEKSALGTRMLASLVNSGHYMGIERSGSFLAEIEKEQVKQRSGDIDDGQISELGRQFGVKYVCIAAITPAFGSHQVSARIVDVETAVVVFIGEAASPLRTMDDLAEVSDKVVRSMFGKQAQSSPRETRISEPAKPLPPPSAAQSEKSQAARRRTAGYYIAGRYLFPITESISEWGALTVEGGIVNQNNGFNGIEVGWGQDKEVFNLGVMLNGGREHDLRLADLAFAWGFSGGLWYSGFPKVTGEDTLTSNSSIKSINKYTKTTHNLGLGSLFLRLRWRMIEFSYKGMINQKLEYTEYTDPYFFLLGDGGTIGSTVSGGHLERRSVWGYENYLTLGVYFVTSNRKR
jgi:hypothetical protein